MDLHKQIKALQCQVVQDAPWSGRYHNGYVAGFEDARHAAAELAAGVEAERAELLAVCQAVLTHYSASLDHQPGYVRMAREAIAKATQPAA